MNGIVFALALAIIAAVWLPIVGRMRRTPWSGLTGRLALRLNELGEVATLTAAEKLVEQLEALSTQIDAQLAVDVSSLPDAEATAANVELNGLIERQVALTERHRVAKEQEIRRQADADGQRRAGQIRPPARVLSEPKAYDDTRHSYFLDLVRDALGRGDGDGGLGSARERLQRHGAELDVDLPARQAARDEHAEKQADGLVGSRNGISRRNRGNMFEKRVNPNRTDGQGGFFVPPLWLVDEYIDLPRFGRTTASLCKNMDLPSGTDTINLPKVATGTTTGAQADNGAVSSTDLTDTSVSAGVKTVAGQQDVAIQLLDQSPVSFDEVVFADLIADYNAQIDTQVVNGGGGTSLSGILGTAGINAVTYTDATPTLPELWVPLLQSASQIAKNRKLGAATGVVMTPSLWYWSLSQLDTSGRPLILPNTNAFNPMGDGGLLEADGPAGMFTYGLPAFLDGNIPSNLGAGTNETRVITARWQDLFLWEGSLRTRVLQEVLSGTLQIRLQVYNYAAFMANRRPSSISVISGTGVIPTAGF